MKNLLPFAVWILMISIGMSLNLRELVTNWRQLTIVNWLTLLLATFILPPALVLLMARVIPLQLSEVAGLFMVAVAPGAPLLTRGIAKKGFDMQLAASYQVWGALLTPVMIPLIVAAAGKLYNRDIWISPLVLVKQIAEKQFVPLLAGIALMYFAQTAIRLQFSGECNPDNRSGRSADQDGTRTKATDALGFRCRHHPRPRIHGRDFTFALEEPSRQFYACPQQRQPARRPRAVAYWTVLA